ncbi:MAG: SMI1/KNR4 family protein [Rivularia sp. (in: cyanobacteria)]
MISDWQKLLEQIEVKKDRLTLARKEEFLEFEERTGIILPAGYKEYCQIFGQGQIGYNVIDIYIPYCDDRWQLELYTEEEREIIASHDDNSVYDETELNNCRIIKKLLNSGLVFATNDKPQSFFWDLNSYSGDDESYDIYGMSYNGFVSCKLGRDFFRFVCDYCLGMKKYDDISLEFQLEDEEIAWVFRY